MGKIAFDNEQYLKTQSGHIRQRISQFGGKLYLEFGGKLYDDNHASRVLPGFQPDSKLKMLTQLKDQVEMVIGNHLRPGCDPVGGCVSQLWPLRFQRGADTLR